MELRDDLQVAGRIPVEPVGAVRDERVDPSTQSSVEIPSLVLEAARQGWATPDGRKPDIVERLTEIATSPETPAKTAVYAAKVLAEIDQIQYARDHPEEVGRARGASETNINVVSDLEQLLKRASEQRRCKVIEDRMKEVEVESHQNQVQGRDGPGVPASGEGGGQLDQDARAEGRLGEGHG